MQPMPQSICAEVATVLLGAHSHQSLFVDSIVMELLQNSPIIPNNPDPSTSLHLYLIEGSLDEIARYAGSTVSWII